jgi:hypothetical protein
MCEIYKQAQLIAVAVNHSLPFSLAEWNLAMFKLPDSFQYFSSSATVNTAEARRCFNDLIVFKSLIRGINWIGELATTSWFKRAWTA